MASVPVAVVGAPTVEGPGPCLRPEDARLLLVHHNLQGPQAVSDGCPLEPLLVDHGLQTRAVTWVELSYLQEQKFSILCYISGVATKMSHFNKCQHNFHQFHLTCLSPN